MFRSRKSEEDTATDIMIKIDKSCILWIRIADVYTDVCSIFLKILNLIQSIEYFAKKHIKVLTHAKNYDILLVIKEG